MLAHIQRLKHALGMSHGELMKLARELSEDGALVSIAHLNANGQRRLMFELMLLANQRGVLSDGVLTAA